MKSSVLIVRPCRLSLQYFMNSGDGALGSVDKRVGLLAGMLDVEAEMRLAGEGKGEGDAGAFDALAPTTDQALPADDVATDDVARDAVGARVVRGDPVDVPYPALPALAPPDGVLGALDLPLAPTTDHAPPPPAFVLEPTTEPCKFDADVLRLAESAYPLRRAIA